MYLQGSKRFNATLIIAVLLSLGLAGCAEETDTGQDDFSYIETFPADVIRKSIDSLQTGEPISPVPAHHDFAFSNYKSTTPFDENTLSAPFDLQQLLTTLALGANGTSQEALSAASGFDLSNPSVYAGISIWEQGIEGLDSTERGRFLWGQREYHFATTYLQTQAELFGPVMDGLDFLGDPLSSQSYIEGVLGSQAGISTINNRTRLLAAQTTQFNTGWPATHSIESISGRFGAHEEQRTVDMLRITGMLRTAVGANYQATEVPLADSGLMLIMIIPAQGQFDTVRQSLNAALLADIRDQFYSENQSAQDTTVYIPKFMLTRELTGNELQDLGDALSETAADFSRVNHAGYLYLETPAQHISLALDEQGISGRTTSAATHTATEDEPPSLIGPTPDGGGSSGIVIITQPSNQPCFYPPEQSPFLFVIHDTATDTLLHLGQVRALDGPLVEPDWSVPLFAASCGTTPPVEVYKYNNSLQCDPNSGIPLWDMEQELINAGIEVYESYQSNDGLAYITLCGSPDGTINVFRIPESQVPLAESLGYNRL